MGSAFKDSANFLGLQIFGKKIASIKDMCRFFPCHCSLNNITIYLAFTLFRYFKSGRDDLSIWEDVHIIYIYIYSLYMRDLSIWRFEYLSGFLEPISQDILRTLSFLFL